MIKYGTLMSSLNQLNSIQFMRDPDMNFKLHLKNHSILFYVLVWARRVVQRDDKPYIALTIHCMYMNEGSLFSFFYTNKTPHQTLNEITHSGNSWICTQHLLHYHYHLIQNSGKIPRNNLATYRLLRWTMMKCAITIDSISALCAWQAVEFDRFYELRQVRKVRRQVNVQYKFTRQQV